jgi:DNA repair protein RadC
MEESPKALTIKTWAEEDRPREKLLLKGRHSLSNAELIAILIATGSGKETAVDLAKRIMDGVSNNLNELGKLGVAELCKFKGIGEAKAISIIAALEIGKRRQGTDALEKPKMESSKQLFQFATAFGGFALRSFFVDLYESSESCHSSSSDE